jgi:hypothetical protein
LRNETNERIKNKIEKKRFSVMKMIYCLIQSFQQVAIRVEDAKNEVAKFLG